MNSLINFVKKIKLGQILMAFVAGVFLFATQACAATSDLAAKTPVGAEMTTKDHPDPRNYSPEGTPLSPYQGGMNNFSDRDPRAPKELKAATKAQAEYLKEHANRREFGASTSDVVDRYSEVPEVVGKGIQSSAENLKQMTEENAQDFGRGTKRGLANIQDNIENASQDVTKSAKLTAENQGINIKEGAEELGYKAQKAADNTSEYLQNKAKKTVNSVQRNLDKAANAIQEAVD